GKCSMVSEAMVLHCSRASSRGDFFLRLAGAVRLGDGRDAVVLDQLFRQILGWSRRRERLLRAGVKLVFEFQNETLRRPRAGFAKGADGFSGDVVGDVF